MHFFASGALAAVALVRTWLYVALPRVFAVIHIDNGAENSLDPFERTFYARVEPMPTSVVRQRLQVGIFQAAVQPGLILPAEVNLRLVNRAS